MKTVDLNQWVYVGSCVHLYTCRIRTLFLPAIRVTPAKLLVLLLSWKLHLLVCLASCLVNYGSLRAPRQRDYKFRRAAGGGAIFRGAD